MTEPHGPVRLDGTVTLAEPDPAWPRTFRALADPIRVALGDTVMRLEHVGSTSVPGLCAKPVIDLLLLVPDPADEDAYVPALEALGHRFWLREPGADEHRLLKHERPAATLHVLPAGSDEVRRMLAFRDHLRSDDTDRELYAASKRRLATRTWEYVQDYADAKDAVVDDILGRARGGPFRRLGP